MIHIKIAIMIFFMSIASYGCTFFSYTFAPNYTKEQCKKMESNFDKLKIGMTKPDVISLIGKESKDKVYPYSGLFPEHQNQWEIWLLCVDSDSCVIQVSGKKQCYKWHMIAFDIKTDTLLKVFSDNPERIGFT